MSRVRPQVLGVPQLLDPDRTGHGPRFQHPRRSHAVHELTNPVVIDDPDELRDREARVPSSHAHGELVAEIADLGFSNAGNPEMFAQVGGDFAVEVIERDNAVELPSRAQDS